MAPHQLIREAFMLVYFSMWRGSSATGIILDLVIVCGMYGVSLEGLLCWIWGVYCLSCSMFFFRKWTHCMQYFLHA